MALRRKREQTAEEILPEARKPQVSSGSKAESDVDAMGKDKRRAVIGHAYGPSKKSQFIFFAVVIAVIVLAVGGYSALIQAFDQPADSYPDKAPWSSSTASTRSPADPCGEPGNPYPIAVTNPCSEIYQRTNAPLALGEGVPTPDHDSTGANAVDTSNADNTAEQNAADGPGPSGTQDDYSFLDEPGQ